MSAKDDLGVAPFDFAAHLRTPEEVAAFLQDALDDGDEAALVVAVGHAARAVGMHEVARRAGLNRTSLYRALAPDATPRFDTLAKVIAAPGMRIRITPATTDAA